MRETPPATDGAPDSSQARTSGLVLALLSAFAFGSSGVAAKPLIEAGLEPLHVTWLRVAGAALVMLPPAWRHRSLVRERPWLLLGFGLLAVAGVQAFYFTALSRIPVGVALLIEYLAPALVLLWVRFVQRRPVTRAAAMGVVLAVGGLGCVVEIWSGLRLDGLGLLLALGAACCQVGYFVLSDHGSAPEGPGLESSGGSGDRPPADPLGVIAYGLLIGTLVLTLVARPWNLDWTVLGGQAEMDGTPVNAPLLLAWIVLIATVTAYLTGVLSVRMLSPQVAGVVACLEAVIATVLAWVLLGEHLSAVQLTGGAVVLLGAFIAQRSAPKAPSQAASARPPSRGGAGDGRADDRRKGADTDVNVR
ncbi:MULTISPECIES: DMT family transporter [unclassified Streptomyces]|uniref:EamA family transporter n=1 Tax=unclassified Streptomyces TaxID=2593676 RepID=UPI002DD86E32|nr:MULTISPECIES: DMT family transporter [unclassified Streptomyces]WSA96561.1 DMT family transporter [Streptomyces sp. NBC_01795]WSB80976.1 DMT family transporter [Streptomyces sp. NBC_01775]WSS10813.1 DMT family transporter [Streptomyces sp. NBC_01186]WSS39512.1 DMT family transporter [Streptomyces sp. NBC_01187]